jgi:inosine/xanthosine triphosphatase
MRKFAEDMLEITPERISSGKIDPAGKRLAPVVLALGSMNPSKREGIERGAVRLFDKASVVQIEAKSGVNEQPYGHETMQGAKNRAKAAFSAVAGADYGIGIESGLFDFDKELMDVAVCCVWDGEYFTIGSSMGFQMPKAAISMLKTEKDLGAAMSKLSGIEKIGYKKGAIYHLSGELLSRQDMNEQAFLCAMIPRISEAKGIMKYR